MVRRWLSFFLALSTARALSTSVQRADLLRHPLDKDLTNLVRLTPGLGLLERGVRFGLGRSLAPYSQLENLAFAIRVSEAQYPRIHQSFLEACEVLGIEEAPELFVRQNPRPNAYTLAIDGPNRTVVATSSLVALLTDAELKAVLAHELGHIACEHSVWLTVGGLVWPNAPVLGPALETLLGDWRRAAELTCDRAALLVVQDPDVVASALLKLLSGLEDPDVDACRQQALDYQAALATTNPLVRTVFQRQVLRRLTHPLPLARVAELDEWAASADYKRVRATIAKAK